MRHQTLKFLSIILILTLVTGVNAQGVRQVTTRSQFSVELNENTIVKDSTGTRVPYQTVLKLVSSGAYTLNAVRDNNGKVIEYKLRPTRPDDKGKRTATLQTNGAQNAVKVGQTIPTYNMLAIDNSVVSSDKFKDKIVVINFWFTVCKPCLAEMDGLNQLAANYKGNPNVVFIAPDWETREVVEAFLRSHTLNYTVCPEATKLIDALKIQAYPTNLIVKNGVVLNSYSGGLPGIEDVLKRDIEEALK